MKRRRLISRTCLILLAVLLIVVPAQAEQVGKKWRLGLSVGSFNGSDDVPSDAANVLTLVDSQLRTSSVFLDPRSDSSVFGSLDLASAPIAMFNAQYAVNDIFILQGAVGYQKGDLDDIEMQVQFTGTRTPPEIPFGFETFRISAGEIERVPLQFTALARFRPRTRLNPYIGAGLGYAFIGYDPSDELNTLSSRMDSSVGGLSRLTAAFPGPSELILPSASQRRDLEGAKVSAPDTFEWHMQGGFEYSVRRKWVIYGEVTWTIASRKLRVGFDGGTDLGNAVPQLTDYEFAPVGSQTFGAISIASGGLIDGGSLTLLPREDQPEDTNCDLFPMSCELVFQVGELDGLLDPGQYYVQGGNIRYDGLAWSFGFRYTF